MIKICFLAAALVAASAVAALAQGDKALQGRPMGGLAMSMQDEQAMEAASLARKAPTPAQRQMRLQRNMMVNAR